jgi:DUF1365 family protein
MNALRQAQIGFGQVRHARLKPARHAFAYAGYFWLLPLRSLAQAPNDSVKRNARGWLSFHDADHGDGRADALTWCDELLVQAGVWTPELAQGEVWLQAYPRVLGYAFKPVSFWYVHRPDGALHAVVAEVNNTFGERHCYVLSGPDLRWGHEVQADKVFHVSPFCQAEGSYRFRFMRTADRLLACVDHDDAHGPVITTSISGELHPLTPATVRRAVWGWPVMTFGVLARIHWQALQLWLKRVPFFSKPEPPSHFVSGPQGHRSS